MALTLSAVLDEPGYGISTTRHHGDDVLQKFISGERAAGKPTRGMWLVPNNSLQVGSEFNLCTTER